jgi:hypothetical protein
MRLIVVTAGLTPHTSHILLSAIYLPPYMTIFEAFMKREGPNGY